MRGKGMQPRRPHHPAATPHDELLMELGMHPTEPETQLTADAVRKAFSYAHGVLYWAVPHGNNARVGRIAGTPNRAGYWYISIDGKRYLRHRCVWAWHTGTWPAGQVDHMNGKPGDDRFDNLRDVAAAWNSQNTRRAHRDNTTGHLGVTVRYNRHGVGRFMAQLYANQKQHYLGTFATAAEAHQAYLDAKRLMHAGCTI